MLCTVHDDTPLVSVLYSSFPRLLDMDEPRSRSHSNSSTSSRPTATAASPDVPRSFASYSRPETQYQQLDPPSQVNHPRITPRTTAVPTSAPPLITSFHRYDTSFAGARTAPVDYNPASTSPEIDSNLDHPRAKRRLDTSSQEGEEEEITPGRILRPTTIFVSPPKKRTRTLTTPHQSAVLHALLAKSRFPTTAQREEVGRQIGMSARKVQVWFQNQRQKAKRPQTQGSPSVPSGSKSIHDSSFPGTSTMEFTPVSSSHSSPEVFYPSGMSSFRIDRLHSGGESDVERHGYRRSLLEMPLRSTHVRRSFSLSGPGIPGPPRPARIHTQGLHIHEIEGASSPEQPSRHSNDTSFYSPHYQRSPVEARSMAHAEAEGTTRYSPPYSIRSAPSSSVYRGRRESLTLPPLRVDTSRPPSLDSPRGEESREESGTVLPPPMTLEPRPLWTATQLPPSGFGRFVPSTASSRRSSRSSFDFGRPLISTSPITSRAGRARSPSSSPVSPHHTYGGGRRESRVFSPSSFPPLTPLSPRQSPEMPLRTYTTRYDPVHSRDKDETDSNNQT